MPVEMVEMMEGLASPHYQTGFLCCLRSGLMLLSLVPGGIIPGFVGQSQPCSGVPNILDIPYGKKGALLYSLCIVVPHYPLLP
jgi:hypothetical protein